MKVLVWKTEYEDEILKSSFQIYTSQICTHSLITHSLLRFVQDPLYVGSVYMKV